MAPIDPPKKSINIPKQQNSKMGKKAGSIPNKSLHSRVSYLYQAATYLATQQQHSKENSSTDTRSEASSMTELEPNSGSSLQPAARHLVSDLRNVSLKVQIRMSPDMKHSICKICSTVLIDGSSCTSEVENKSKGGKKPWADVLVRRCNACGSAKRFPMTAARQKRRPHRTPQDKTPNADNKGS